MSVGLLLPGIPFTSARLEGLNNLPGSLLPLFVDEPIGASDLRHDDYQDGENGKPHHEYLRRVSSYRSNASRLEKAA
jgi:hypothetical protein